LQFAEWLEENGSIVTGLEAIRPGPDFEATDSDGSTSAIEVKFIGASDEEFATLVQAMNGSNWIPEMASAPLGVNYLLFRVYEAAKQLEPVTGRRTAAVLVDDLTWGINFDAQIRHNWIDWSDPRFLPRAGEKWDAFIEHQQETRFPDLLSDLGATVRSLTSVMVMRRSYGYRYHRELHAIM
jgi:hypothetical protein